MEEDEDGDRKKNEGNYTNLIPKDLSQVVASPQHLEKSTLPPSPSLGTSLKFYGNA